MTYKPLLVLFRTYSKDAHLRQRYHQQRNGKLFNFTRGYILEEDPDTPPP